ncbi:MAG: protein tyrosine phosphatase family protein [Sphingomonas sp.]|nr:protein tyrosine phosphatase family protein [Sphingomonas sp.]
MTPDESGIYNFRRLSPTLTTSGQPDEAQFAVLRDAGVETVVNLALSTSPRALPDEAATLAALGLRYIHIPVEFTAPTEANFEAFATAMGELGDAPVHVHCAANMRVSAFLYRYRIERLGWTEAQARPDLDAIWEPDPIWQNFLEQG